MAKKNGDGDKVGRGNPPKHTQFRPGQSGNPSGRPKGCKNMRTLFQEELSQTVSFKENGKNVQAPLAVVLMRKALSNAMSGDGAACLKMLDLIFKHDIPTPEAANDNDGDELAPDDEAILAVYVHRIRGEDRNE